MSSDRSRPGDKVSADPGAPFRLQAQVPLRRKAGEKVEGSAFGTLEVPSPTHTESSRQTARWLPAFTWETAIFLVICGSFIASALLAARGSTWQDRGQLALLATVPLLAVLLVLAWVDRWAPLALKYKLFAVGWGGGIAAVISVVVNSSLFADILLYTGDENRAVSLASNVVAPIGEELFKGLGVIAILIVARNELGSALSAMALAGMIGAGFAFVENLEYFWQALQEGSTVFGFTVFARSVLSPFVHPMATSFIGLAVGSALIRRPHPLGWVWRIGAGYGVAVAVHALWNGLASLGAAWILWYILLEIPLFSAWIIALLVWAQRQAKPVAAGLEAYVEAGWIDQTEALIVVYSPARKKSVKWAKTIGKPAPRYLREFRWALGHLGLDQQIMTRHGLAEKRVELDRTYLQRAIDLRKELVTLEELHLVNTGSRRD